MNHHQQACYFTSRYCFDGEPCHLFHLVAWDYAFSEGITYEMNTGYRISWVWGLN